MRNLGDVATMSDNSLQKNSTAFRLPVLDPDFLLGGSMRGVRLQLEYAKAEERLRAWTVRSTVVVFGSARARPGNQLERWYEDARRFGKLVSERGGAPISDHGIRDNVIATGGGPGIMEAVNRGAADAGAPSIGFNIGLPHEQEPNDLDLFSCSRPRDANEPDIGLREAKRNRQRAAQWWSQYRGTASR